MCASRSLRRLVFICLLLLFGLAVGCGRQGTVSGKIYFKGQPVTGGTVYFHPEGIAGNYPSIIGTDGSYSVSKLPTGPAKISVMVGMKGPPPGLGIRGGPMAADRAAKGMKQMERIAKNTSGGGEEFGKTKENTPMDPKYMDPDTSGLKIDVTGGSQTFDIKLE